MDGESSLSGPELSKECIVLLCVVKCLVLLRKKIKLEETKQICITFILNIFNTVL